MDALVLNPNVKSMMFHEFHGKPKGTNTVYTTCRCNCGGNQHCVIKAHIKDGKVVAVEPDDRYNPNVGREDSILSEVDFINNRLQRRPCVMGLAFHKYIYHSERILYPLKRIPQTARGEGKYTRISWDEALTTITNKMKETRKKYGPYSIMAPFSNTTAKYLFSFWGAGVVGWGASSWDAGRLMSQIITGERAADTPGCSSSSAADMLAHAKIIVLWGFDPTVSHYGPAHQFAWFIKLAREKGTPVIIIDPRYSSAAGTLADQWIPIKPGTDHAMFMAMSHVLFKEDIYDKDFITKYVEPIGFKKWKDYILGLDDGIEKTPEWAEVKCAVPADTIRELAKTVSKMKPAWLWANWSLSRKSDGERIVGAFSALQAMLGNLGVPGAGPVIRIGPNRPIPLAEWYTFRKPGEGYQVPMLYRGHNWAEAVLLLDNVRSGEITEKEYMRMVGWKAAPSYFKDFNPKFLFAGSSMTPHSSDYVSTVCNSSNNQIKAMQKMEFVFTMHSIMSSSARYADIILPTRDWMWEEKGVAKSEYGGFESINYCPEVIKPPGEVKSWVWIYTKIAERLGIDPKKFFRYYTNDENWESDWERYQKDIYQGVMEYYGNKSIAAPTWEEFTSGKFINCDELEGVPFTGWEEQIHHGKPFSTESGKIELYSKYIDNESNRGRSPHYDATGRTYDDLPADWGAMKPSPTYRAVPRGMDDPLTVKYPLLMLTSHSRYRVHYLFWEHLWLRNHVYRHRVWINTADAKARGIKDNDEIMVYNDRGKIVMPAYVTHRMMPGTILLHAGGKVVLNESGIDYGASPSTLLGGEFDSCLTPARATNLVQVEKYSGE